jgi:hypothetical protein
VGAPMNTQAVIMGRAGVGVEGEGGGGEFRMANC